MDQLGIKEKKKMKVNGEWVRMRMSLNYADNTEIKERMGMVENKKNDVCRCIARVYRWGALRPHRCSNPVWKDGYCKTHHREGRE